MWVVSCNGLPELEAEIIMIRSKNSLPLRTPYEEGFDAGSAHMTGVYHNQSLTAAAAHCATRIPTTFSMRNGYANSEITDAMRALLESASRDDRLIILREMLVFEANNKLEET